MNWLIYISGWFWGLGLVNAHVKYETNKKNENFFMCVKLVLWTMTWIWVCWKFIR